MLKSRIGTISMYKRLLIVCGVTFAVLAGVLLFWPRSSSTNPCGSGCNTLEWETVTYLTERGLPLTWSRTFSVTEMNGSSQEHTIVDQQKLLFDVSVLLLPMFILAVLIRVAEQNKRNGPQ